MARNLVETLPELVFVEKQGEHRKLMILHSKSVRPDGSFQYVEIGRVTPEQLERMNEKGKRTALAVPA